ncbi:HAD family hydrolase [Myxosarcina sp. GI1]|uniref:HAD family hydrolase n=1 Tax=Myxosarcina sp. GI1 TaxID=1541065 RepID=UPI0005698BE2|nr:HAD family hydrolase [Myxosarcina sp. GI1]
MDKLQAVAVIFLWDKVREKTKEALSKLQSENIRSVMIIGDVGAFAHTIANELWIDKYHARVLPEDKVNIIKQVKQKTYSFCWR